MKPDSFISITASAALTVASLLIIAIPGNVWAQAQTAIANPQRHKGSPSSLALDVAFLQNGKALYGVIHDVTDSDVSLVVQREWLRDNHPALYKNHAESEQAATRDNESEMLSRVNGWIQERPDDVNLVVFLEAELAAAKARLKEVQPESLRFTIVRLPKSDIRRTVLQTANRRQLGLLGWKHNLAEVEIRTAVDLKRELTRRNVSIKQNSLVDFSEEVPALAQSDQQWAIRKCIVEFVLRESLEFQGSGNKFFRRGESPGMATLLTQMMSQGGIGGSGSLQEIGEELGIPEFTRNKAAKSRRKSRWDWADQAKIAEREGFRSFTMTRLNQNLASPEVTVDIAFIGKDHRDQWQRLATFQGKANADKQAQEDIQALMQDPQVKQILEVAQGLGLDTSGQIEKALRHGVATQAALQDGMNRFVEFTDRFSQSLTGPLIKVPTADSN